MAQVIDVPGYGPTEFPDGMSDGDIVAAIQKNMVAPQPQPKSAGGITDLFSKYITGPLKASAESIIEPALTIGTGMVGQIAGNVAGAAGDVYSMATGGPTISEAVNKDVREALTYQPRSSGARQNLQSIAQGMNTEVGKMVQGLPMADLAMMGNLAKMSGPAAEQAVQMAKTEAGIVRQALPKFKPADLRLTPAQIEAANLARERGINVNPAVSNPTIANKTLVQVAGGSEFDKKVAASNIGKPEDIAKRDLGVERLNSDTLKAKRAEIAEPINELKTVGVIQPDEKLAPSLQGLLPDDLAGMEGAKRINKVVSNIIEGTQDGIDAARLWNTIRTLRSEGSKGFHSPDAKTANVAQAKMKIARELEAWMDRSIQDPALIAQVRQARADLAKSYAYESALNQGTERLNMSALAKMVEGDNALSGEIKNLATIAANLPGAFKSKTSGWDALKTHLSRTGVGGTLGGLIGEAGLGIPWYQAAPLGAAAGEALGMGVSRRLLSPGSQAIRAVPAGALRQLATSATNSSLSLAPVGEPLIPPKQQSPTPQGRGLLSLADEQTTSPQTTAANTIEFPIEPRLRGLYERGGVPTQPAGLTLEPKLGMPTVNMTQQGATPQGRGLLSLADDQPIARPTKPIESIPFELKQEVLQRPEIVAPTQAFIGEAVRLRGLIENASGFWKKRYQDQLTALEKEFGAGMRQLGVDNAIDALGLKPLYEHGVATKLPVEKTFSGMLKP